MAAVTIEQQRAVALANARARAAESGGIPEGRKGTRYDFLPPTSMVRQAGNMFDVARDVFTQSQANAPTALGAAAQPFVDMLSGAKRGFEDLTQGVPALVNLPGARDYKNQKEAQYQSATQNRTAAAVPRLATQAAIAYGGTGGLATGIRAVPVAQNAAMRLARRQAALAIESGGFKAPNMLAKVVAGGTTGAGGALLTDQDVGLSTLIGGALPVVAPAAGKFILDIFDKVTGSAGAARAADMMRQALGDKWQQALQVLKSAPDNLTATQALQEAGIEAPIFTSMGRDIETGLGAPGLRPLFQQQEQARLNTLAEMSGGSNSTAARTARGKAKDTLNALTKPMLDAELGAANIGRIIPGLEAQAQQFGQEAAGAVDKVRTMMPFSEKMAEQGINPNMKKYVGSAPYDVLQTDAQRTAQYYAGRAENLGTDEAARSLTMGKASRDATQIAQNLRDAGLNPLDTKSLTGQLTKVLDNPNYASLDEVDRGVNRVLEEIQKWTAKGGGVIDARALYSIRKNAVNAAVRDLLGPNASADAQARAAAGVMSEINPLIDKAIKTAGGEGWPEYLTAFSSGMKDIERSQLAAKGAEFLRNKKPEEFIKLVQGNNEEAVEKIFGANSYDILHEMTPAQLGQLQKVAKELQRDLDIDELATVGKANAVEILRQTRGLPTRVLSVLTRSNPKLNAASSFADALLEIRLAPKTQAALVDGFKSGKSAAELLAIVPTKDRLAASKLFNNPSFWRSSAAVTTNALAPANANTNALAQ